tara:strand:+ start:1102 stop:1494 length:393 start_codon:yes stop_codon:yes gene_type:complete
MLKLKFYFLSFLLTIIKLCLVESNCRPIAENLIKVFTKPYIIDSCVEAEAEAAADTATLSKSFPYNNNVALLYDREIYGVINTGVDENEFYSVFSDQTSVKTAAGENLPIPNNTLGMSITAREFWLKKTT